MFNTKCETCGNEIPVERLNALPDTTTCVDCSEVEKVRGHVYWEGKHTPVLEVKTGELPVTRKGFHAQLPFNSTSNPRMVASMANLNLSQQIKEEPQIEFEVQATIPARCHPDRRRATPDGKCVECAVKWYTDRRR